MLPVLTWAAACSDRIGWSDLYFDDGKKIILARLAVKIILCDHAVIDTLGSCKAWVPVLVYSKGGQLGSCPSVPWFVLLKDSCPGRDFLLSCKQSVNENLFTFLKSCEPRQGDRLKKSFWGLCREKAQPRARSVARVFRWQRPSSYLQTIRAKNTGLAGTGPWPS